MNEKKHCKVCGAEIVFKFNVTSVHYVNVSDEDYDVNTKFENIDMKEIDVVCSKDEKHDFGTYEEFREWIDTHLARLKLKGKYLFFPHLP